MNMYYNYSNNHCYLGHNKQMTPTMIQMSQMPLHQIIIITIRITQQTKQINTIMNLTREYNNKDNIRPTRT